MNSIRIILFLAVILALPADSHAGILFVNINATGANDGTSWTDAFTSVQSALTAANDPDEIWVAAGIYKPTTSAIRTSTFQLINSVALSYKLQIIMITENKRSIVAPRYNHRSYIWGRTLSTQYIFLDFYYGGTP
ncbi:MAG: hypothetical protein ABIA59_07965 [Candidatus Latescibacterota bacterium]